MTYEFTTATAAGFKVFPQGHINCPHARPMMNYGVCDECRKVRQVLVSHTGGCYWGTEKEIAAMFPFTFSNERLAELFGTPENVEITRQELLVRMGDAQ